MPGTFGTRFFPLIGRQRGIVKKLLEYNADINHQDNHGLTALAHACINLDYDLIEILLNENADPNIRTTNFINHVITICLFRLLTHFKISVRDQLNVA